MRIVGRRQVFKWLPVLCQNDLCHGAWWLMWAGVLATLIPLAPLVNLYVLGGAFFWPVPYVNLISVADHTAVYAVLAGCGVFYTASAALLLRAFGDPTPRPLCGCGTSAPPLLAQTDEVLASWCFFLGTVPSVPVVVIYYHYLPAQQVLYGVAILVCAGAAATTLLATLAVYPHPDGTPLRGMVAPLLHWGCGCCCGKKTRCHPHVQTDWLIVCWLAVWGSWAATLACAGALGWYAYRRDPLEMYNYAAGCVDLALAAVGSMYLVAGSYPVDETLSRQPPAARRDSSDSSDDSDDSDSEGEEEQKRDKGRKKEKAEADSDDSDDDDVERGVSAAKPGSALALYRARKNSAAGVGATVPSQLPRATSVSSSSSSAAAAQAAAQASAKVMAAKAEAAAGDRLGKRGSTASVSVSDTASISASASASGETRRKQGGRGGQGRREESKEQEEEDGKSGGGVAWAMPTPRPPTRRPEPPQPPPPAAAAGDRGQGKGSTARSSGRGAAATASPSPVTAKGGAEAPAVPVIAAEVDLRTAFPWLLAHAPPNPFLQADIDRGARQARSAASTGNTGGGGGGGGAQQPRSRSPSPPTVSTVSTFLSSSVSHCTSIGGAQHSGVVCVTGAVARPGDRATGLRPPLLPVVPAPQVVLRTSQSAARQQAAEAAAPSLAQTDSASVSSAASRASRRARTAGLGPRPINPFADL